MLRKLIFKTERGEEVTLPVTPKSYFVRTGMTVQTIDVYELGPYSVPTYEARSSFALECLLPSSNRSYCVQYTEQSILLDWIKRQITGKAKMRFIVSDTAVNIPVYLTEIEYGEQDGTNDLYVTLTLQPYATLSAPTVQKAAPAESQTVRETTPQQTSETTYTVKTGDNLWNICRKFYGDGSLCYKLAAYNGIKNANLIYTGQVLKIPDAATLGATAATQTASPSTDQIASSGTAATSKQNSSGGMTYTVRILMIGEQVGCASYYYVNAKTGKTAAAKVGTGATLTQVPAGSTVTIRWNSSPGCYVTKVKLNARTQSAEGSIRLNVSASQVLELYWGK